MIMNNCYLIDYLLIKRALRIKISGFLSQQVWALQSSSLELSDGSAPKMIL